MAYGLDEGNVLLSQLSTGEPCPDYYLFRCDVVESLRQDWIVAGVNIRFGLNSEPDVYTHKDPFNFYIEEVSSVDSAGATNFVSYLWFSAAVFNESLNVTCGSRETIKTILLKKNG